MQSYIVDVETNTTAILLTQNSLEEGQRTDDDDVIKLVGETQLARCM